MVGGSHQKGGICKIRTMIRNIYFSEETRVLKIKISYSQQENIGFL